MLQLAARNQAMRGVEAIIHAHNRTVARMRKAEAGHRKQEDEIEALTKANVLLKHQSSHATGSLVASEETRAELDAKEQKINELTAEMMQLLKAKHKESSHEVELHRRVETLEELLKDREESLSKMSRESMRLETDNEKLLQNLLDHAKQFQLLEDEHRAIVLEHTTTSKQLEGKKEELNLLVERWLKEKEHEAQRLNSVNRAADQASNDRVKAELLAAAEGRDVDDIPATSHLDEYFGGGSTVPTQLHKRKEHAHTGDIGSCAFKPDGSKFATGSVDRAVKIWDASGDTLLTTLGSSKSAIPCLLYSPDGETMATGAQDSQLRLYNTRTGRVLHTMNNHTDRILGLAFVNAGNTLFSASKDHTIKCWDTKRGALKSSVLCDATCYALAPYEASCLVGAHFDRTLRLRDPRADLKATVAQIETNHAEAITHIVANPADGCRILTSSKDSTLMEFDMRTLQRVRIYSAADYKVDRAGCQPCYSPDGMYVASGSGSGTVHIWDAITGAVQPTLADGHTSGVLACSWSPRGSSLVTVSKDKSFVIWD